MAKHTITGNLAADVEVVKAGSINITEFRVIENTGEYRHGKYTPHPDPTTYFVEAKLELGHNAAATLHKGDAVIVIVHEHTIRWGDDGAKTYGRVVEADNIGVDLTRAVAENCRVTRDDTGD